MGIFSVNVVGMAMIEIAYFYPPAFGFEGLADKLLWLVNFLLVDGKLRSLFCIMFGASMMLVIDRAIAAGRGQTFPLALEQAERIYLDELCRTEDIEEGIAAYLAKWPPQWRHR